MPATDLKIVGTGACLPWCSISSSFQNSLMSGHWGLSSGLLVLEFGSIFAWYRFPAAEDFVVIFVFLFNDVPNVLYRWKSGLQAGQFSTHTLLLPSHAVVIAAVCGFALSCWNTQGLPNRHRLEGSICFSKTFIYLSALIVPSKTCKLPIPYPLVHPIPSEILAFELNVDNRLEGLPPL